MLITGPEIIKTVTGEDVGFEELGGARTHNTKSGNEYYLGTYEEDAVEYVIFSSRRRHTSCRRDWSSDVCSSDLGVGDVHRVRRSLRARAVRGRGERLRA